MKIAVCVVVAPSTDTKVKIGADGQTIDMSDVKLELNAYDEFAIEEALRLKESTGDGEVVLFSVGSPATIKEEIRKGLARGADRAVILDTDTTQLDSSAVAALLTGEIKAFEPEIIFMGKQSVDYDSAQVPSQVAAAMGWPVVTKVSSLAIEGGAFRAEREIEGGVEVVEGTLPAVISAEKGLNEPRYPSLKGIMAAKKKPMEEKAAEAPAPVLVIDCLELPPPRPEGKIVGEGPEAAAKVVELLRNEAKVI